MGVAMKVCAQDSAAGHGVRLITEHITYCNNFSASYTNYKNWKYNGYNNYSFLIRLNLNYDSVGTVWQTHFRFVNELGYTKFTDSSWYKSSDYLDLSAEIIKSSGKRIENIFSLYGTTQFISDYEFYINDSGVAGRRWVSGFGNPMNVDVSYGATINFWKNCRFNLMYVTFRVNTSPLLGGSAGNDWAYHGAKISSQYGLSLQTFIRRSFGKHIRWENTTRLFGNSFNRSGFDIDMKNRVVIKIFKYLDLILDNRIRYMPVIPYRFQFRNELMLSLTIEKVG